MTENFEALLSQRLKAALDAGTFYALIGQPLLGQARSLAAAPTHDVNVVMFGTNALPRGDTLFSHCAGYQLVA